MASWLCCASALPGAERPKEQRIATIKAFFKVMQASRQPTIADFERLFGDANENELDLQLLYEGWRSQTRAAPDPVVRRVNARLLKPEKYPSLYLCFLREQLPATRDPAWRIAGRPRRSPDGLLFYRVETQDGPLLFQFSDDERVIEVLMQSNGMPINSDVFHGLCKRGDCCAIAQSSRPHLPSPGASPTPIATPAATPSLIPEHRD